MQGWEKSGLFPSTVKEFLNAPYYRAVATVAGWIVRACDKDQIGGMDNLKKAAIDVTQCIVTSTKDMPEVQDHKAAETALMCMVILKKQYPWFLKEK